MVVKMIENINLEEPEIIIKCSKANESIIKLISIIKNYDESNKKIIGILEGETYCLNPEEIFYFEAVERKTFCYTKKEVYEVTLKLFEIEEKYGEFEYIRSSKSSVININKIKSIKPDFGGRILATMENNEKIYISRQYVSLLKKKLGIGGK